MNKYPPSNPTEGTFVPDVPSPDQLAVTGVEVSYLLVVAVTLIFLGVWAIMHVGKKSDRHHEDS